MARPTIHEIYRPVRYAIWLAIAYVSVIHPLVYLLKLHIPFFKESAYQLGIWLLIIFIPFMCGEFYYLWRMLKRRFKLQPG